jgi:hypothetical protein
MLQYDLDWYTAHFAPTSGANPSQFAAGFSALCAAQRMTGSSGKFRSPKTFRGAPRNSERLARFATDLGFLGKNGSIASSLRRMLERGTFKLDYFYTEGLPGSLGWFNPLLDLFKPGGAFFGRHKFLQYRRWFERDLAYFVDEKVREVASRESELWNTAYLRRPLAESANGKIIWTRETDIILTLEAAERLFFRGFTKKSRSSVRPASFQQPTLPV